MKIASTVAAWVLMGLLVHAQVPSPVTPTTQQPSPAQPGTQPAPPGTPPAPVPGAAPVPTPILPPVPVAPLATRTFTAKSGLLFTPVRPERVVDFETVIGLLKDALANTTDAALRAQAAGWQIYKATEPGPNATVLYVFVIDPAIPGADYGLGRILSDAYPDRIQEIWKLYTGALAGGGSLLNLSPVEPPPPTPNTPILGAPETAPSAVGPTTARPAPPVRTAPPAP